MKNLMPSIEVMMAALLMLVLMGSCFYQRTQVVKLKSLLGKSIGQTEEVIEISKTWKQAYEACRTSSIPQTLTNNVSFELFAP